MQESHRIELKSRLTDDLEKEVVAFLNSREGGEIYIGYNDDGTILGVENADDVMLNINNRLRSRISPSIMGLFAVELENMSDLQVIKVSLSSGSEKPYFITSKGMSIRGCFLRVGTAAEPMEQRMIDDLFSKRTRNSLRKIRSNKQDLTFEQLKIYFQEQGLTLNEHFAATLEFLTEDGTYNYVAYLMADNNSTSIKVARYSGLDRSDLIESPELGHCSLVKSAKQILDMFDLKNTVITEITGKERKQSRAWDPIALREAVLNALVHNDFTYEVPPKFEFFKDRIEITSAGGLPQGLSQEEFFEGFSVPRNKEIMRIFRDLRLVEQLGSGIPRILHSYSRDCFRFSENFVRMSFPSSSISNQLEDHQLGSAQLANNDDDIFTEVKREFGSVSLRLEAGKEKNLTFLRNNYGLFTGYLRVIYGLNAEEIQTTFGERVLNIIQLLAIEIPITQSQIALILGVSESSIEKDFALLRKEEMIERSGSKKTGIWKLIKHA